MTFLDETPSTSAAAIDQARDALRAGDLDAAERLAQTAMDTDPRSIDALNLLGNIAIRRGRPPDAVRLFALAAAQDAGPVSAYNHALALDTAGRRADAAKAYAAVLARHPNHATAPQRLVKALFAVGDGASVVTFARTVTPETPLDADACYLIAVSGLRHGAATLAEDFLNRALDRQPGHVPAALLKAGPKLADGDYAGALRVLDAANSDHADVQTLMAKACQGLGRTKEALDHFLKVCAIDDARVEAHAGAGRLLHAAGRHEEAVVHLLPLHRADPADTDLATRLVESLLALERKDTAIEVIRATLNTGPEGVGVWNGLSIHLKTAGDKELAVRCLRAAILRDPTAAGLYYNAGFTCNELMLAEDGEVLLRRATCIQPDYAKAWNALGVSLSIQFRAVESEAAARRAVGCNGAAASAWLNLGITQRAQGRLTEAVTNFRKAITLKDRYAEAHHNLAITLLMMGEIREGFQNYDWRFALPDFPSPKRAFPQPEWTGQDLSDCGILVYMEQGMGDEVMFSWYIHHLRRIAKRVVLDCDKRLVPLFARSFPGVDVIGRSNDDHPFKSAPDVRYKIPAGHLPKLFWAETREQIYRTCHLAGRRWVRTDGHLAVDPDRVAHWRGYLAERAEGRPLVGLSWRSAMHTRMRDIQYLAPSDIARALPDGLCMVNLQYATEPEEVAAFEALGRQHGFRFVHPDGIDLKDDLDDVMALISALDLVVTPLISVAWMAGALGVPTWVFRTSEINRVWQQLGMPYIPWYPSMRLFFRGVLEPWDQPLATVRSEIEAWRAAR